MKKSIDWSTRLRTELRERAFQFVARHKCPHYISRGSPPTVLFNRTSDGLNHGNFQPDSFEAICAIPAWGTRLDKAHSQKDALPPDKEKDARELDSSNSSDALLMNCFCFPGVANGILDTFGLAVENEPPEFGFKARIPLVDGTKDTTEIDMRIGAHLFEAKLTEKDFTTRSKAHVARYRDLADVFDIAMLPVVDEHYTSYQLIRNVLAAAHHNSSLGTRAECDYHRSHPSPLLPAQDRCVQLGFRLRS